VFDVPVMAEIGGRSIATQFVHHMTTWLRPSRRA
jgi:hypothetical protein